MGSIRCPHPSHGAEPVPLKSTKDQVFECRESHRYYLRDVEGKPALVDLITGESFPMTEMEAPEAGKDAASRRRLVFMSDIPRVTGELDFDKLSLTASEWKILSKVDGRSTLEEVRLLAGLRADEAEVLFHSLMDAGLLEIRGRR